MLFKDASSLLQTMQKRFDMAVRMRMVWDTPMSLNKSNGQSGPVFSTIAFQLLLAWVHVTVVLYCSVQCVRTLSVNRERSFRNAEIFSSSVIIGQGWSEKKKEDWDSIESEQQELEGILLEIWVKMRHQYSLPTWLADSYFNVISDKPNHLL